MQLVRTDKHAKTGHTGGAAIAREVGEKLKTVVDSRTMAVAGALDPTNVIDHAYRQHYGHGIVEGIFMNPSQRALIRFRHRNCRGSNDCL